jgi:4-azaleucine resistance transporter AzlC
MGVLMFTGTGQFVGVGLFAAGAGLLEIAAVQLVLAARHAAYGLSMAGRFRDVKMPFKLYLIYALTDETFALLSSLPDSASSEDEKGLYYFLISLLDHSYWLLGSTIGAVAGSLLPFGIKGVGFSLTALFIVLMIEQMFRVKKARLFCVSALIAVLSVAALSPRISLFAAIFAAIAVEGSGVFKHFGSFFRKTNA